MLYHHPGTASWIIVEKATGKAVFETFTRAVADKVNTEKYEAVPVLKYLASLNKPRETK